MVRRNWLSLWTRGLLNEIILYVCDLGYLLREYNEWNIFKWNYIEIFSNFEHCNIFIIWCK